MRLEFIVETANSSAESASPAFKCESDRQMKHSLSLSLSLSIYLSLFIEDGKRRCRGNRRRPKRLAQQRRSWSGKARSTLERQCDRHFLSFFFFAPFFCFTKQMKHVVFVPVSKEPPRPRNGVGRMLEKQTKKQQQNKEPNEIGKKNHRPMKHFLSFQWRISSFSSVSQTWG